MKTRVFIVPALLCATYLCVVLIGLGLDKFHYVLAGGRKFATFPDLNSQIAIGLSYLTLNILYLLWFFRDQKSHTSASFTPILQGSALFLLLAFLSYPLGDDTYLYMHAGLMNLSGINPFITRAAAFTSQLSPYVDWGQTSTYGPVSQLLFTVSAAFVQIHPVLAIYIFKLFCLGLHILNGYAIWKILPAPQRGKIALAYLLHPLLLMEQVGSGHVDVLVSTSLVIFAGSFLKRRYSSAFVALWAGFLSKTIPLIWMPLVGVFLIKKRRWGQLATVIALSIGLISVLWVTALPGLAAWGSLLNPGVEGQYQSSLMALAKFGLDLIRIFDPVDMTLSEQKAILAVLGRCLLAVFALFYGWMVLRIWQRPTYTHSNLLEDMGWVTTFLLLFSTSWLMPWYASILLTFTALLPRSSLFGLTALTFALSSGAQYLLQGHDSLKALVSIGVPVLVWAIGSRMLEPQPVESELVIIATPKASPQTVDLQADSSSNPTRLRKG